MRESEVQRVYRALDPPTTSVEDMGVDHRGADLPVPEELLDRAGVIGVLEQVGGERVTECVQVARLVTRNSPTAAATRPPADDIGRGP